MPSGVPPPHPLLGQKQSQGEIQSVCPLPPLPGGRWGFFPAGEVPWDISRLHSLALCLRNVPGTWERPPHKGRVLVVEPHCSHDGKGSRGISKGKAETLGTA